MQVFNQRCADDIKGLETHYKRQFYYGEKKSPEIRLAEKKKKNNRRIEKVFEELD